jgi:hypothetical protein
MDKSGQQLIFFIVGGFTLGLVFQLLLGEEERIF